MKWKRSKKAQQEAKAKAAEDRKRSKKAAGKVKSENVPDCNEDGMLSDDQEEDEEEEIDVGSESSLDQAVRPSPPAGNGVVAPQPLIPLLPPPPSLLLRGHAPGSVPTTSSQLMDPQTTLGSLLPAHLARLGGANWRPFVA